MDNIVAVAACNQNGQLAPFSNYGNRTVLVAAPGVRVRSCTSLPNEFGCMNGTSQATPQVAATLAMMVELFPSCTHTEIIDRLYSSVDRVDALVTNELDLVLTSRFIGQNGIEEWNLLRKILTRLGHTLTVFFLKTSKDLTSGMRGYRVLGIDLQMLDWLIDSHYEFLPKSFYYYKKRKSRIDQIAIILPKRAYGSSKNNLKLMSKNAIAILFTSLQYSYHFRRNKNDS
jgi:hypothetical protein